MENSEQKICNKCGENKLISEFYKNRAKCKTCFSEQTKQYKIKNSKKIKEQKSEYCKKNKKRIDEYSKQHYLRNKKRKRKLAKIWQSNNIKELRIKRANYDKKKRCEEPSYRLRKNLKQKLSFHLKQCGKEKTISVKELTTLTRLELKAYLESKFTEGMTWNNYGNNGWHLGHIKPCEIFDLRDENEQKLCFHFSNLIPQWEKENLSEGDILQNGARARFVSYDKKREIRIEIYGEDIKI